MTPAIPAWQPFDLAADGAPDSLRQVLDAEGGTLVVVGAPGTDSAYAVRGVLRVAGLAAEGGERVLLIDLDVARSALGRQLGESAGEGLSDVLLFGASLPRVARAVEDGAFLFAPTGTIVGDRSRVLDHPGWSALLASHTGPGRTVVLYLGELEAGGLPLIERADGLVVLGGSETPPEATLLPEGVPVAWLGPVDAETTPDGTRDFDERTGLAGLGFDRAGAEGIDEPGETGSAPPQPGSLSGEGAEPFGTDDADLAEEMGSWSDPLAADPLDLPAVPADDVEPVESTEPADTEALAGLGYEHSAGLEPDPAIQDDAPAPLTADPGDVASLELTLAEELTAQTPPDDPGDEMAQEELDPFWDEAGAALSAESAPDPLFEPSASRAPEAEVEAEAVTAAPAEPAMDGTSPRSGSRLALLAILVFVAAALIVWGLMGWGADPTADASVGSDPAPVQVSASRPAEPPPEDEDVAESVEEPGPEVAPSAAAAVPAEGQPAEGLETDAAPTPPEGDETLAPFPEGGLRFGLTINSHERVEAAQQQANELADRFPDLTFVLAPVAVNGIGYFRVIAGPASTAAAAEGVRNALSGYLGASVAQGAIVRSLRLAYLLGEFEDLDDAEAQQSRAATAGIPAYVTVVDESVGSRYRVYAGAYGNETEATYMKIMLADAGLESSPLSERTGRPLR